MGYFSRKKNAPKVDGKRRKHLNTWPLFDDRGRHIGYVRRDGVLFTRYGNVAQQWLPHLRGLSVRRSKTWIELDLARKAVPSTWFVAPKKRAAA